MDAITTALLQQYGGGKSPLLLHPVPSLAGLLSGSAVQTYNPQPDLPQAGAPALPQQHARNTSADSMLNQLRESTAAAARQAEQQQQQSSGGGGGGLGMLGSALGSSMNSPYWMNKMFGGGWGNAQATAANISPSALDMSSFTMPKIFG